MEDGSFVDARTLGYFHHENNAAYDGNRILHLSMKDEWFSRSAGYPLSTGGGLVLWADYTNQADYTVLLEMSLSKTLNFALFITATLGHSITR